MGLSVLGMGAASVGYLSPIEGVILQEIIDLAAILNSLRMIMPTAPLGDFTRTIAPSDAADSSRRPRLNVIAVPKHQG